MSGYKPKTGDAGEMIANAMRHRVPVIALWIGVEAPPSVVERVSQALALTAQEFTASAVMQLDADGTKVAADKNMYIELIHPPKTRHHLDSEAVGARLSFHMLNPPSGGSA